jgi:hypothetical protein
MKRRTLDLTLAWVAMVVAVVLAIAGGLLVFAANFNSTTVTNELSAQKIFFPPAAALQGPEYGDLAQYAGQQVTTGQLAKAYSDMIAVHVSKVAGGKTYSQVSEEWIAGGMKDQTLAQQRQTLFMGETLRGLLLNTYAFSIFGQVAMIAGIVSFIGAAFLLVLSILGFVHASKTPKDVVLGAPHVESIPA